MGRGSLNFFFFEVPALGSSAGHFCDVPQIIAKALGHGCSWPFKNPNPSPPMGGSWLLCPWFLPPLFFGFLRWIPGLDRRLPLLSWDGVPGRGFLLPPRLSRGLLVAPFLVLFGMRNTRRFYGRSFHISNSRPGSFCGRLFPAETLLSGLPPYSPILSHGLRPSLLLADLPCAVAAGPFSGRPFTFLRFGPRSPWVFLAP